MKVEHPAAWHFIMQDDIYFLNKDKPLYETTVTPVLAADMEELKPVVTIALPEPAKPAYLGKYKKGFLILVHYPAIEFIAESHLTALENILKRKGFEIDDVAILNMAKHGSFTADALLGHFKPKKLLLLGKYAMPVGIKSLTLNEPAALSDIMALYSFSFDEMMESNELKKAFWDQMKNL